MSYLAIDLGASNTRITSNDGVVSTLPNNAVFLDMDARIKAKTDDVGIEDCLEVFIKHTPSKDIVNPEDKKFVEEMYPMHALMGSLASREMTSTFTPNAMSNKMNQRINYLSILVASAIEKVNKGLDNNLELYIVLPPAEVRENEEDIIQKLKGEYTVTFPRWYEHPEEIKLNFVDVQVRCESHAAVMSFMFSKKVAVNDKAKDFIKKTVLSIDIGASTTDFVITQGGTIQDKTGFTSKIGGNAVRGIVSSRINGIKGYKPSTAECDMAVAEGRLKDGSDNNDITEILDAAKKQVANSIVSEIPEYFTSINMTLQSIDVVIVSGGGSMASQYINEDGEVVETTKPMSSYITNELSKICKGIQVLNHSDNPRMANIDGLYVIAHSRELNAERKKK